MPPEAVARLTPNPEVGTAIGHPAPHALVPLTVSPLPDRLLCLAACRLREGLTPPRSYYWWGNGVGPVRPETRAI